jgi:hypothetical protein
MTQDEQDGIITWYKIDEPGELPVWESVCGVVEQLTWGDNLNYAGYILRRKTTPDIQRSTFLSAKRAVEHGYIKAYGRVRFAWERVLEDVVVSLKRRRKSARELSKCHQP